MSMCFEMQVFLKFMNLTHNIGFVRFCCERGVVVKLKIDVRIKVSFFWPYNRALARDSESVSSC